MPETTSARAHDPFRSYKFEVNCTAIKDVLGFQKVTGLKEASDVIEYREGIDPIWKRKIPGLTNYDPVTLTRGASSTGAIIGWRAQVASTQNKGDGAPGEEFRKEVTISLIDKGSSQNKAVRKWTLMNAWPAELNYSDLNAEGSEVLIESLVLVNEGIKVENV